MSPRYMDIRGSYHLEKIRGVERAVRFPAIGNLIITCHSARCALSVPAKGDVLRIVVEIEYGIGKAVDLVARVTIEAKGGSSDEIIWSDRGRLAKIPFLKEIVKLFRQIPGPKAGPGNNHTFKSQGRWIWQVKIVTGTAGTSRGKGFT